MPDPIRVTVWNEFRHETYPIYHDANVMTVIANAVRWAAPRIVKADNCPRSPAIESIRSRDTAAAKVG